MKKKYLADFARERGVNPGTISAYIRRHPELFDGHTEMDGKKMLLDEAALQILDEIYPVPEAVQIVENIETVKELAEARKELAAVQAQVIELQGKILSMTERAVLADQKILLIEDKDQQISDLQQDLSEALDAVEVEKERTAGEAARADRLQQEIDSFIPSFFGFWKKKK